MITIIQSPTYKQEYTTPQGDVNVFDFNVVAALSNVGYKLKSIQAPLSNIRNQGGYALLSLRENITTYLAEVQGVTGKHPVVYLDDLRIDGYIYSNVYQVAEFSTVGSATQLLLKMQNSEEFTYFGDADFTAEQGQLAYRYKDTLTYQIYQLINYNGSIRSIPRIKVRQPVGMSGYNTFNLSEIARGYVDQSGSAVFSVEIQESDYFHNSSSISTDPAVFINARNSNVNYGNYTIFNPNNSGSGLPSIGHVLLYNSQKVYPFYLNFVTNDVVSEFGALMYLRVSYLKNNEELGNSRINIPAIIGLNTLDISKISTITDVVRVLTPDRIVFQLEYSSNLSGEFSSEFTAEFMTGHGGSYMLSGTIDINCTEYILDPRRDFYFSYQNSIGGISTYLCTQYRRITEPEIVALRNAESISNALARETSLIELAFKYQDLDQIKLLFGYDLMSLKKEDGIFESQFVTQHAHDGDTLQWIIKGSSYDIQNSDLYKDITITLYRPLSSGHDTFAL